MNIEREEVLQVLEKTKFNYALLIKKGDRIIDAVLFDVLYPRLFDLILKYKSFVELFSEQITFEIINGRGEQVNVLDIPIMFNEDRETNTKESIHRGYQ